MTRFMLFLTLVLLVCGLGFCTREDGLPDPPVQQLVPCDPDAGQDDPLVCPAAGSDVDMLPPGDQADAGGDV